MDGEDAAAFNQWFSYRMRQGRVQAKGGVWRRWRDAAEYLTGTVCTFRDEDPTNLCRDNLIPVLRAWDSTRQKWT